MKISVLLEGIEILSFDSKAMLPDPFGDALKQAAIVIYSKWLSETPQTDHRIKITER